MNPFGEIISGHMEEYEALKNRRDLTIQEHERKLALQGTIFSWNELDKQPLYGISCSSGVFNFTKLK
jgi:hypothetical protein